MGGFLCTHLILLELYKMKNMVKKNKNPIYQYKILTYLYLLLLQINNNKPIVKAYGGLFVYAFVIIKVMQSEKFV